MNNTTEEKRSSKQSIVLDTLYYNLQHRRVLMLPYIFLMKKTIIYTVIAIILVNILGFSLFLMAFIVGGYWIIYTKFFPYKIEDKEKLWAYNILGDYLGLNNNPIDDRDLKST